jgi:hypothetical protein
VVLVQFNTEFLTNTTPSARLRLLRGILTSRSHPSSAEEGSPVTLQPRAPDEAADKHHKRESKARV